jgi:hypothetical protein
MGRCQIRGSTICSGLGLKNILQISLSKNQISPKSGYIEIIHGSSNVVISKEWDEIWRDFGAGFCLRFDLDKSACFKVISQVSLVDANP